MLECLDFTAQLIYVCLFLVTEIALLLFSVLKYICKEALRKL